MKILLASAVIAATLTSASTQAADTKPGPGPFMEKVIWSESQGRVENNAVVMASDQSCSGDLAIDILNIQLPDVKGTWQVDSWATKASNLDAFIIRLDANHVYEGPGKFPSLSTVLKPTAEVFLVCREKAKLTINTDEKGDVVFGTHDPDMVEALEKADVNYTLNQD